MPMNNCFHLTFDRPFIDLSTKPSARLKLKISCCGYRQEKLLAIDISISVPPSEKPQTVAEWRITGHDRDYVEVIIRREDDLIFLNGVSPQPFGSTPSPSIDVTGRRQAILEASLRPADDRRKRFVDFIHLYLVEESLIAAQKKQQGRANKRRLVPGSVPRFFNWPLSCCLHIVAHDIYQGDAVGNFACDLADLLSANQVPCQLYAVNFDRELRPRIRHTVELFHSIKSKDLIILSMSIYDPYIDFIQRQPCKKIIYYHGITPPHLLTDHEPVTAALCQKGLDQLVELDGFSYFLTNSDFSANQLSQHVNCSGGRPDGREPSMLICPPVIGLDRWTRVDERPVQISNNDLCLLYVGRVVPHKRIEHLIDVFIQVKRKKPRSILLIAGKSENNDYIKFLNEKISHSDVQIRDDILFLGFVSESQLKYLYQRADSFVIMSEHEGFCLPVVEAMYFGLPVFSRAGGALPETMGGTGIIYYDSTAEAIASDICWVSDNPEIKASIVHQQRKQFETLAQCADGRIIWRALRETLYTDESTF